MGSNESGMVLVVDDDTRNLGVISRTLTHSGFDVAVATNGIRGIQIAKTQKPDLILLDVRMEGIDGFETCRRLKADPDTIDIPVIFLTASSELTTNRVAGLRLGAVDYILKPFHHEELLARIQVHTKLRRVMVNLAAQIEERMTAESALQRLTRDLERRVAERTAELEKALSGLVQAKAEMATIIRAAQTIAGELVLDRVLDLLLRIALEHAGAEKCILILMRGDALVVEAFITKDAGAVQTGLSTPLEPGAKLAVTIVQAVVKDREALVVADTGSDARFAADSYITGNRPKSILCVPMVYQGKISGVLYLENDAKSRQFTTAQVETLSLLGSQAAVAVTVALLYDALRKSNDRLELDVARQTEELRLTNERLKVELVERERAEEERKVLQEKIISGQRMALQELSTPLIPIANGVVVMPLIGTIDSQRAQQIMETLLRGVGAYLAKTVIIDVTGVQVVDTHVADVLVKASRAVKLLGAEAVLTGIRPEVAMTLVGMGADLGNIVTHGNLQTGIAYALMRAQDQRFRT
jgi:DNA-binding response OmpR family regulator/anti-anti-sigma regulatory factor/putative methionine-R-sulfoxide reductase with GAF domain